MVHEDEFGADGSDRTRPDPLLLGEAAPRAEKPRFVGRFRVLGLLGAGGMGEVFSGHDPVLDRIVAIKRLRSDRVQTGEQRRRLQDEARASARLSHPNIVTVHDLVHHDDADHIVTEYVDGRSLRDWTTNARPSLDRALEILAAVAEGLRHAHEHREAVVHRDLKTENVLVGLDGSVKITDFGISHSLRSVDAGPIAHGSGTVRSMSPEQSRGEPTDARSDLFSLGILVYEVIAGASPFEGRSVEETLANIRSRPHRPLSDWAPDVPPELGRLVDRLLEKHPLERPRSAAEVAEALRRILAVRREARLVAGHQPRIDRRQVAIVHLAAVDLALVDEEERAGRIAAFQRVVADAIEGLHGHLVYAAGREALVCVGWPEAHEHNGARAAALVTEVAARAPARVRAALDIGDVFVMSTPATPLLVGAPIDHAVRLGRGPEPAAFVVGVRAYPLLARHLRMVAKSARPADGGGPFYEVLGPLEDHAEGSVLVGRARELRHLRSLWATTASGTGMAVAIAGEAGIGKTRLVRELARTIARGRVVRVQAQVATRSVPFAALRDALADLVGLAGESDTGRRRDRVRSLLARVGDRDEDRLAALAHIFAVADARDEERLAAVAPRARPSFLQEQLAEALVRIADAEPPLTLVVEDLHWLDHSSLQVIDLLAARTGSSPLALVLTHRSEWQHTWRDGSAVVDLPLRRLTDADARELVHGLAGGRSIAPAVAEIVQRAEGVPLVLGELTQAVLDGGADGVDRVPMSLADSIATRLQRLAAEPRCVVEIAAVLGREIDTDVLAAAADLRPVELAGHLETLVRKGLLVQDGFGTERRHAFGHSLTRDAIHDQLERSRRLALHARVAAVIESSATDPDTRSDRVAQHYEAAEAWLRALEVWLQGARAATARMAWALARARYERALEIVLRHGDPDRRRAQERAIREPLAALLVATEGWGAAIVERNAARLHELAAQGDEELPWTALWQDWAMGYVTGNMAVMSAAFGRLDERVQREPRHPHEVAERELIRYLLASARGAVYVHLGLLAQARDQLTAALALRGPLLPVLRSFPQVEPILVPTSYLQWVHVYLGDLEESWRVQRKDEDDVDLGEAARSCARAFALAPAVVTQDWHAVELRAHGVIDEAPGVLAPQFAAVARFSLELVELQRRAKGTGIADPGELDAALDGLWIHFEDWWREGQMRASSPFYAAIVAETCIAIVRNEGSHPACAPAALSRARKLVDWALGEVRGPDNEIHRIYASEVHRIHAELLAMERRTGEADVALAEARACAAWVSRNSGQAACWLEDRVADTARRLGLSTGRAAAR